MATYRATEMDPVALAAELAQLDDEPYTETERAEVERRKASAREGNVVSHAELMRRLGL